MTDSGIDISVIIVSYNSRTHLALALAAIRRASEGLSAEVIVVDNASHDGTADWLSIEHPWVRLTALKENIGFSRANNIAMEQCTGRIVLLLNPDTIIPQNTLKDLVAHFDANPGSGAVGVHMTNGLGQFLKESKRGYPGLKTSFFKLTRLWHLNPKSATLNAYYIGDKGEFDVCHAPNLSGACMAFTHNLLDKTGGFAPEFFMYCEDTDLSWRMEKASKTGNVYRGDISILHFKGQSTLRRKEFIWHFYKSMQIFARKHEFPHHCWLVNQITKIGIWVAFSFSMMRCIFLQMIERNRSFALPKHAALVTDKEERLLAFRQMAQPDIESIEACSYDSLDRLTATDFDAVIFDTDSRDFETALRFMEKNQGKTVYAFCDIGGNSCLAFFNNRCHSLLKE